MPLASSNNTTFAAEDGDGYDGHDGFGRDNGRKNRHDVNDTDNDAPRQEDEGVPRASLDFEDLFDVRCSSTGGASGGGAEKASTTV